MKQVLGEQQLLGPLLSFLRKRGRVRYDTIIAEEFPWHGRRVDLATLTASRRAIAFELKLRDNGGAIEQAISNRLSFDRSYVVTATRPGERHLGLARGSLVGIIVVNLDTLDVDPILKSPASTIPPSVRRQLLKKMRIHGSTLSYVR